MPSCSSRRKRSKCEIRTIVVVLVLATLIALTAAVWIFRLLFFQHRSGNSNSNSRLTGSGQSNTTSSPTVTLRQVLPTMEPTTTPSLVPQPPTTMRPTIMAAPSNNVLPATTTQPTLAPTLQPTSVRPTTNAPVQVSPPANTTTPTAQPNTLTPTDAPTNYPTRPFDNNDAAFPVHPVPDRIPRSYFNYDPQDRWYGPESWYNVDTSDSYLQEFGWNNNNNNRPNSIWNDRIPNVPTRNRCHHYGRQSPVNLIQTNGPDSECTAIHQIRTRGGKLRLPHESIEKTIESNKLRITLNRRNCLDLDNRDCVENRPPMADYPNFSNTVTHFSDLLNVDVKIPGEHYLNGQGFDAELQLLHIHLDSYRLTSIGVPIVASPQAHHAKFQHLLDEFQLVYDRHQAECDARQVNQRRFLRNFYRTMMEPEGQQENKHYDTLYSSLLDDPDLQRRLEEERTTLFDPYTDFFNTVYFYRYNGGLTEPPCYPMTWFVLSTPLQISVAQLQQAKQLLFTHVDGNCQPTSVHNEEQSVGRPLQPLGDERDVSLCTEEHFVADIFKDQEEGEG